MLRTFDPARRAVLTTDVSNLAVAAGGGPCRAGIPTLATRRRSTPSGGVLDRQPSDHVAQDEPASEQDVRPLTRRDRGLPLRRDAPALRTQPDGPAVATRICGRRRPRGVHGRPRPKESQTQQELFSRLGRDAPAPALLAAIRVGWAHARRAAAAAFDHVQAPGGGRTPLHTARGGGGGINPLCTSMFIALAGPELPVSAGTTQAPPPPFLSNNSSRRRSYRPWRRGWPSTLRNPSLRGGRAGQALSARRPGPPPPSPTPHTHRRAGRSSFWCVVASPTAANRARAASACRRRRAASTDAPRLR